MTQDLYNFMDNFAQHPQNTPDFCRKSQLTNGLF